MEHTRLPWKITDSNRHGDIYIGSKATHHFIIVENSPFTGSDTKANADFIVLACNAHKDLLAACEALMELADDGSASFDDPEPGGIYDKARAAIAAAQP